MAFDIAQIVEDIKAGLPKWRDDARKHHTQLAYYRNLGHEHVLKRPAEEVEDYERRVKVAVPMVGKVIDELAKGCYADPGPSRVVSPDPASVLYDLLDSQHHVNCVLHKADVLSTLHGLSAIQVLPDTRDGAVSKVRLNVLGADRFKVWCDAETGEPAAILVVQPDEYAKNLTFKIWTATEVQTWFTKANTTPDYYTKAAQFQNLSFEFDDSDKSSFEHGLGALPFVLVPYGKGTLGRPVGLGESLVNTAKGVDQLLSNLWDSMNAFGIPIERAQNVSATQSSTVRTGDTAVDIPQSDLQPVSREFTQPDLKVQDHWDHCERQWNATLKALDVPLTISLDYESSAESGVAVAQKTVPLSNLWRVRQAEFKRIEDELARLVVRVAGVNFPGLVHNWPAVASAAKVSLSFSEKAFVGKRSGDQVMVDEFDLRTRLTSPQRLYAKYYGGTIESAERELLAIQEEWDRLGFVVEGSDQGADIQANSSVEARDENPAGDESGQAISPVGDG